MSHEREVGERGLSDLKRRGLRNLIIVPQFIVPRPDIFLGNPWDLGSWLPKSYHCKDHLRCFIEINRAGVELAAADSSALLIPSGTATDGRNTLTEAQGFELLAEKLGWFGHPEVKSRMYPEIFATTSYLNLIYSICRFFEVTGKYPDRVLIPGMSYKEGRFSLHRMAIRWPEDRFEYIGVCDPPDEDIVKALEAEIKNIDEFRRFPHGKGSHEPIRNQHLFMPSYPWTNPPTIRELLLRTGSERVYAGPLPWDPWPRDITEEFKAHAEKVLQYLEVMLKERRARIKVVTTSSAGRA